MWTGPTQCASGASCYSINPYYYQCTPGSGNAVATAASTATAVAHNNNNSSGSLSSGSSNSGSSSSGSNNSDSSSSSSNNSGSTTSGTDDTDTSGSASSGTSGTGSSGSTSSGIKGSSGSGSTGSTGSTSSGTTGSGSSSGDSLQTVSGGFSGSGKTTRYWDCCAPSYCWTGKSQSTKGTIQVCDKSGNVITGTDFQSGCNGGTAYMCPDQVPTVVSDTLAYGFAAASISGATDETLACACIKLTFTSTSIKGKSLVVQISNTGGDLGSNQFDLALPGGGGGIYSDGCSNEFGSGYSWGEQYGGI
ncbi:unnamed protein product [Ambrosiozyma monospora]|uniref:Unnamed protein product n=1 Tax=Ambrosiozyma monospora TaxID=43982 RepID=A0ACB5UAE5_AMBMO|nr:unnamed protein product [Ambrosiozyma monospora]